MGRVLRARGRLAAMRTELAAACLVAALMGATAAYAFSGCDSLEAILSEREKASQNLTKIKTSSKPKWACYLLSQFEELNTKAITALNRDGAWCRKPEYLQLTLTELQTRNNPIKIGWCNYATNMERTSKLASQPKDTSRLQPPQIASSNANGGCNLKWTLVELACFGLKSPANQLNCEADIQRHINEECQ